MERRILVVEDDCALAQTLAAVLQLAGWRVDVRYDGESAVDAVREHAFDLLLLDLKLPGMGGLAALERIRSLPDPPQVLVASAHLDAHNIHAALRAGAAEILEKPVDSRQLLALLDGYAGGPVSAQGSARRDALDPIHAVPEILGESPGMRLVREQIVNVARYKDMPVLITGETGTGKELVAQAIHRLSGRPDGIYELNCAALPAELFESEVFGHESGAFTGARGARVGLFEAAGRGTVFLDELGEMPALAQAKLLRVLENRTFRRLGSNRTLELRARIISATNRSLRGRDGDSLRSDLFFRLAGYTIRTPPLRERIEDIELLAPHLLRRFSQDCPPASFEISPRAVEALQAHDWPGNVRELRSVIHNAAARANGAVVGVREVALALRAHGFGEESVHPPPISGTAPLASPRLRDLERDLIASTYAESGGNMSVTAQRLGIPRTTLRDKLKRLGLR